MTWGNNDGILTLDILQISSLERPRIIPNLFFKKWLCSHRAWVGRNTNILTKESSGTLIFYIIAFCNM